MAGQENEADEIAERIGQRQNLYLFSPLRKWRSQRPVGNFLFAPCPWRWTLTMVASTMAYSMSGASEQASKSLTKTPDLIQSR